MGHWFRGEAVEGVMGRFCSGSVASSPIRKPSLRSGDVSLYLSGRGGCGVPPLVLGSSFPSRNASYLMVPSVMQSGRWRLDVPSELWSLLIVYLHLYFCW